MVVVIDDSPSILTFMDTILKKAGYETRCFLDAEEALKFLGETAQSVSLVVCDVMMPHVDGIEVVRRLRTDGNSGGHIPIILVTAKRKLTDKVSGLDSGADDYITKPFKPEELLARVRAQLRIKRLTDTLMQKNKELEEAKREIERQHARLHRALEIASQVQKELLPDRPPLREGYEMETYFSPAETVAGDFYDFIPLDDGRTAIVIGDVAGKGVGASLLMVLVKTLIRTEIRNCTAPSELVERVNGMLHEIHSVPEAITLFVSVMDWDENRLDFCNAGHEFPIVISPRYESLRELGIGGPFIGIFPRLKYNEGTIYLEEGDKLLIFTDGILHRVLKDSIGEGMAPFHERLLQMRDLDARTMMSRLVEEDDGGGERSSQKENDDITVIIMECRRRRSSGILAEARIRASCDNIEELREFIGGVVKTRLHRKNSLFDVLYSLDEAVHNAIVHGYGEDGEGLVHVTLKESPQGVTLEIRDWGKGMELAMLERKRRELKENKLKPDGRGLLLMEALCDRLSIQSGEGEGTTVVFTKHAGEGGGR